MICLCDPNSALVRVDSEQRKFHFVSLLLYQCVRVGNDVSEWFPDNVGLRQGCVMPPWLFNLYMDSVVPEGMLGCLGKGLSC